MELHYISPLEANNDTIRMTLLYTPGLRLLSGFRDQKTQDWGEHTIRYALYAHDGSRSGTDAAARRFNQPIQAFSISDGSDQKTAVGSAPGGVAAGAPDSVPAGIRAGTSLFRVSNPNIGVLSVKKAENTDSMDGADSWLCPISSKNGRRGILAMTASEYIDLVDKSGRMIRSDKRGAIDANLRPILLRMGVNPQAWTETISDFGDRFSLVAGLLCNLRNFADQLGRRWFKGVAAARTAFTLSPPQVG